MAHRPHPQRAREESPEDIPTVFDPGLAFRLGDPDALPTPTGSPPRNPRLRFDRSGSDLRVEDPPTSDTLNQHLDSDAFAEGHRWIDQVKRSRGDLVLRISRQDARYIAASVLACGVCLGAVAWLIFG